MKKTGIYDDLFLVYCIIHIKDIFIQTFEFAFLVYGLNICLFSRKLSIYLYKLSVFIESYKHQLKYFIKNYIIYYIYLSLCH